LATPTVLHARVSGPLTQNITRTQPGSPPSPWKCPSLRPMLPIGRVSEGDPPRRLEPVPPSARPRVRRPLERIAPRDVIRERWPVSRKRPAGSKRHCSLRALGV